MVDTLSNYLGHLPQSAYACGAEDAFSIIHTNDTPVEKALDAVYNIHTLVAENKIVIASKLPAYPFNTSQHLPFEERVNLIIQNIRDIAFTKSILEPTTNVSYGNVQNVTINFGDEVKTGGVNATFCTEGKREIGHIEFIYNPEEKRLSITDLQQRHLRIESEDFELNNSLRKHALVDRPKGQLANVGLTPVIEFNLLCLVKTLADDYHLDLSGGVLLTNNRENYWYGSPLFFDDLVGISVISFLQKLPDAKFNELRDLYDLPSKDEIAKIQVNEEGFEFATQLIEGKLALELYQRYQDYLLALQNKKYIVDGDSIESLLLNSRFVDKILYPYWSVFKDIPSIEHEFGRLFDFETLKELYQYKLIGK
jgi:hypothetical protein